MISLENRTAGGALEKELREFCSQAEPNQAILSERKLAATFEISHSTVRRVMETLLADGLIYKVHGKGSFVAPPPESGQGLRTIVYADSWGNLAHPHYAQRLSGISTEAAVQHMRLEVLQVGHKMENRDRLLADLARDEVVGLIAPWMPRESMARVLAANPRVHVVLTASNHPTPGTSMVGVDHVGMGVLAADYLIEAGACRPLFVCGSAEAAAGAGEFSRVRDIAGTIRRLPDPYQLEPDALVREINELEPDGLAFDDDTVATRVLERLGRPAFPAVSHANAGDTRLPGWIARLEVDGFKLGQLVVQALVAAIDTETHRDISMRLCPTLITPTS